MADDRLTGMPNPNPEQPEMSDDNPNGTDPVSVAAMSPVTTTERENPFNDPYYATLARRRTNPDDDDELCDQTIDLVRPVTSIIFQNLAQCLEFIGGFGRYQVIFLIFIQFTCTEFAGHYVLLTLSVHDTAATCYYNDSTQSPEEITLNKTNHDQFCPIYEAGNCTQMKWTSSVQTTKFKTIIEQWGLICSRDVGDLMNSVILAGPLLLGFLIGTLSDKFGRQRALIYCTLVLLIANSFGTIVQSWQMYLLTRSIATTFCACSISIVFIWSMEKTPPSKQMVTNVANMWHFGYIFAGSIAYVVDGWRYYTVVLCVMAFVRLMIYTTDACVGWGFVESPQWLLQTGNVKEAARSLTIMSAINRGIKHGPVIKPINIKNLSTPADATLSTSYNPFNCCRIFLSARTTFYALVLFVITVAVSAATMAYLFQIKNFHVDPHLMVIIYGALRLFLMPPVIYFDQKCARFGRRHLIMSALGASSLAYATALITEMKWPVDYDPMADESTLDKYRTFALMLTGAIIANFLWVGLGQLIVEIFPSVERNRVGAFTAMADMTQTIITPQIVTLERYLPQILLVYCTALLLTALIVAFLFLPETKGRPMPDDQDDDEIKRFIDDRLLHCHKHPFCWCKCCERPDSDDDHAELLDDIQ